MAGLVGGDSDSSALTQESGDEAAFTPRDSVVTGTDAGTDYEEEQEAQGVSPGLWWLHARGMPIVTTFQCRSHRKLVAVVACQNRGGEVQQEEPEQGRQASVVEARRERNRRSRCRQAVTAVTHYALVILSAQQMGWALRIHACKISPTSPHLLEAYQSVPSGCVAQRQRHLSLLSAPHL